MARAHAVAFSDDRGGILIFGIFIGYCGNKLILILILIRGGRIFSLSPRRGPQTKGLVKSLDFPTQFKGLGDP
jgi:hypothetical protein